MRVDPIPDPSRRWGIGRQFGLCLEIVSFKKLRFSDEQIAFALRQADAGTAPREICRKLGITAQSFYRW
jgi:hypothetical protein